MRTLNLAEAQGRLREIITGPQPGEKIVLTDDKKPVATLRAAPAECLGDTESDFAR